MFSEIYVEAVLADKELADQVWELWHKVVITDEVVAMAWCILVVGDRCLWRIPISLRDTTDYSSLVLPALIVTMMAQCVISPSY